MKKSNFKLQCLLFGLLLVHFLNGQNVNTPQLRSENQTKLSPVILGNKGNEAFCMVTGGLGEKGWAKFYLQNPTTFEILAPKPNGIYFFGSDFGADGTWYVTEWMGGFYSVDTITGQHTLLANLSEVLTGFTYSPAYETYYGCTGSKLFTLDIDTYSLEFVGMMGNSGQMTGLGADNRGNLYGIDLNDDQLYKIDPMTGLAAAIGPTGFNFDYIQSCTYDKNSDVMYHAGFWVIPSAHGGLFTIDTETGQATELTAFPNVQEVVAFGIPWTMPEHGCISGVVTDAFSGDPVENVTVYLQPTNNPLGTNIYKITGSDGMYHFGVTLPGNYSIITESTGYGSVMIENIMVNPGDNLTYNIQLQVAPYVVTFYVYTFEGNFPVEGATINFVNHNQLTNEQGVAIFENVTSGTFEYLVDIEGYYQGFGDVVIVDNDVEEEVFLHEENNIQKNLVIIEEATGTWCVACPQAAMALDQIFEEGYPVGIIAYHSGDVYENTASAARCGYYGITAYPTCTFNGTEQYIGASYSGYLDIVVEMMDDMTPVNIEFGEVSFNFFDNNITGEISISNFGPVNSEHLRLHLALVESHIPENWGGLNELNFVERVMFPDENGTPVDLTNLTTEIVEFEFDLDNILDIANCQIITFVQDNFTKEIYNGRAYDCSLLTGVQDEITSSQIRIFPNPAKDILAIESVEIITQVEVFDITGNQHLIQNCCTDQYKLNVAQLRKGVYFLRAHCGMQVLTKRFVIW